MKTMWLKVWSLTFAASLAGAAADIALAQVPEASDGILASVVVTAGRVEENAASVPVAVTVISGEDIDRLKPFDLGDLLKHYGIQIGEYGLGQGFAAVTMRGFATAGQASDVGDILFLLDGRRYGLNNPSTIPMENIERVEIIKGAASMQYGPEAIGGVVNLISRRGSENFKLKLSQTLGSFGIAKSRLAVSGFSHGFDFSLGGQYARSGAYSLPNGEGFENTGLHFRNQGSANLGYNFNEDHRVGLVVTTHKSVNSRSGGIRPTAANPYNVRYPFGEFQRYNWSWDLNYEGAIPERNLQWLARAHKGFDRYIGTENRFDYTGARYSNIQHDYKGASLSLTWQNSFLRLTGGFDYYNEEMNKTSVPRYSANNDVAGYLIAKVSLLDESLWLTGGVRRDRFTMKTQTASGVNQSDLFRTTPSFGLAYAPTPWLRFRANYSSAYRLPTPNQLTADYVSSGWHNIGNPNVKPQSSNTIEGGLDVSVYEANFSLTYFTTDYKDMIDYKVICPAAACGGTGERTYVNLSGKTEFRGLELSLDWDAGKFFGWDFSLKPSLTLTRMFRYVNTDENGARTVLDSVTDINVSYGLLFSHPEYGLKASLDAYYYGQGIDPLDNRLMGGDTVVDFHLEKELISFNGRGKLSLGLDIVNLTNHYYMTVNPYPQAGRHFLVNLDWEY
ncbi:MAG: TonB-dependent receptor [Deltaproteobacteria bacterium]|jgi:vitamin B12 transporter|nr:TonB-dependent receptor [Deltaproteobacteria bacterium]